MATGAQKGLNPCRKLGSGPDNKGITSYSIASGYATDLGKGDPVKMSSGTLVLATNGADSQGVLQAVDYNPTDTTRQPVYGGHWPASATGTNIVAHVVEDPNATFTATGNGTVAQVLPGNLYAMTLPGVDAYTGRSLGVVNVLATITGSLAVTGTNNAALTGLANADAFTIKSSVANSASTITIVTNQTPAQLLALLNAVPGISASLNASNFLVVTATDGGSIVTVDGTGTPLADSTLLSAAGTTTATVALNASMVKVHKVIDSTNNILEVTLSNSIYRHNV